MINIQFLEYFTHDQQAFMFKKNKMPMLRNLCRQTTTE